MARPPAAGDSYSLVLREAAGAAWAPGLRPPPYPGVPGPPLSQQR